MSSASPLSQDNPHGALLKFQDNPTEHALQTLRTRILGDYKQAVYIPPLAKPSLQATEETLFPLMEKIEGFLASECQVMLILGDSGAGKTTFNRHLEHQLWRKYQTNGVIPLFINLPALDRPDKYLVAEQLKTLDFSDNLIWDLKENRQFVLICDGYDESQLTGNLHTTNIFNKSGHWRVKLIISCRAQYLGKNYRDQFVPKQSNEYHRAANDLYQEAIIAPFTRYQIEDYVEQYIPLEPRTWVKADYMDKLTSIPGLFSLVKNPFLLTLCLEALPSVVQDQSDLSRLQVTRMQLYDNFVSHWLKVNRRRLQDQKLSAEEQREFADLKEDGFAQSAIDFQQDLAAAIFTHQDGKPIVEYTPKNDKNSWKAAFLDSEPRITLLRFASLLTRRGNQHSFVHRSVLEYFYSCTVCPPPDCGDEFGLQVHSDSTDALASIADHPLSQRNLVIEPSIIQFLTERAQTVPEFKRQLHALVERSKTDEHASQAAANAITILIKGGARFNGADLRGVKIPGADLSGGQFDSAQFQEAILTGVNLAKSWIRQTDFSGAQMEKVKFGELPYLLESGEVHACAFSPNGRALALGLDSGDINIYEAATWTRTRVFQGHQGQVTNLAYSPSGQQLVSGSMDKTVRLWNCPTWTTDFILREHTEEVTAVAFSPCGKQVASASDDGSVRLWDAASGAVVYVLTHINKATTIAYSPDGLTIAFGSYDGKIKTFDTRTGLPGLVLEVGPKSVEGKLGRVCSVTFSPDGQWILSGNEAGLLRQWEARNGKAGLFWEGHGGLISSVAYSPNGQWIASASHDRTVKLWNAQAGTLVSALTGHMAPIVDIAFSSDSAQLASCGLDMTVRLWEVNSIITGPSYYGSIGSVTSIAYSPNGECLIYGSNDGSVRRYDSFSDQSSLVLPPGSAQGRDIVYSTDGLRIATTGSDNIVRVWGAETGQESFAFVGNVSGVCNVAFSPCGRWIATGNFSDTVQLRIAHSGVRTRVLTGHTGSVTSLAFSPSGCHVVCCCRQDGSVRIWNVNSYDPPRVLLKRTFSGRINTVAWLPTIPLIAWGYRNNSIRLWNEQAGTLHQILVHDRDICTFGHSSCGHWIAAGCEICVWLWHSSPDDESNTWRNVAIVPNFFEKIRAIIWRPQSLEFVVNCVDGSARAWRLQEEVDRVSAVMIWSNGYTAFEASDAVITETVGLSEINRNLLKQRGAIGESSSSLLSLESQKLPDMLTQRDLSEPSSLSDMEGWQWEEEDGSDAFFSEDEENEEDEEDDDEDDEEEEEERSDSE